MTNMKYHNGLKIICKIKTIDDIYILCKINVKITYFLLNTSCMR